MTMCGKKEARRTGDGATTLADGRRIRTFDTAILVACSDHLSYLYASIKARLASGTLPLGLH